VLRAFVLGVLQGLTEFFPVSSSGHLILARWVSGWDLGSAATEKAFDASTHLGTALAAVVLLRHDIAKMVRSSLRRTRQAFRGTMSTTLSRRPEPAEDSIGPDAPSEDELYFRLALYVLIASVPAGVAGLVGERLVAERLSAPWVVAATMGGFGLLLAGADRFRSKGRTLDAATSADAIVVGTAQVLALVPGVSRSGITIIAALSRGLDRPSAARFSFLLLIPITAAAGAYGTIRAVGSGGLELLAVFGVGIVSSAIAGYIAARFLLRLVSARTFLPFVIYRLAISGLSAILLLVGFRSG
jgi:undecaprenyl-diphosphatase